MAYMCSQCVWFRFVGKELWVGFYLRKEHGLHTHSFLKWETLSEFNRSSVWAGNSEWGCTGDDWGFSGQKSRAYLPHSLRLPGRHQAGAISACVMFGVSPGRSLEQDTLTHAPPHHGPPPWLSLRVPACVPWDLISWVFIHDGNTRKSVETARVDIKSHFSIWILTCAGSFFF